MGGLLKSSIFAVFGSIVQFAVSIVSGILIARSLGPDGKGQVFLIVQFASLGALLLSLGFGTSYLYHLRRGILEKREAIAHSFVLLILFCVISIGLYDFMLPFLREITSHSISDPLINILLILLFLNMAISFISSVLMAEPTGVQLSSVYAVICSVEYLAALFVFLLAFRLDVWSTLIAMGSSLFLRLILMLRVILKQIEGIPILKCLSWNRTLFLYGIGSFAGNLMLASIFRIDTFIINHILGTNPLGIYSVAVNLGEMLLMVPSAVGTALFPHLTSQSDEERVKTAGYVARVSVLLGIAGCCTMLIFGYPIILIMFGWEFRTAYIPLLCLLPGLIAMTTSYGYANYFSSCGKPMWNAGVFGLGMIINIALNFIFIPTFAITGAALVSSVTYNIVMIVFIIIISKTENITWQELVVPTRGDIQAISEKLRAFWINRRFF